MHGIPILVLCNKTDINPHLTEVDVMKGMNLDYIHENSWNIIPISAKVGTNLE